MKTLLVGDTHLKNRIILPLVAEKARALGCQRIILMGDYVDEWRQTNNSALYFAELDFLLAWKKQMEEAGVEIITLLGNHDADYLSLMMRRYSLQYKEDFFRVRTKLLEVGLQVAVEIDGFLVSHAGFTEDYFVVPDDFKILTDDDTEKVAQFNTSVGIERGGRAETGSPIWADFTYELVERPNKIYAKQIVGHSPVPKIVLNNDATPQLIDIDTFSMAPPRNNLFLKFIGNGDVLLLDDGVPSVIATDWQTSDAVQLYLATELG